MNLSSFVIPVLLAAVAVFGTGKRVDVYGALSTLVDPFVNLFRRFIPPLAGLDWSPFIAILVLQLVQRLVL